KVFKIKKFFAIDLLFLGFLRQSFFLLRVLSFSFFAAFYFLFLKLTGKLEDVVFFSHDHLALYFMSFLGAPVVFDIHDFVSGNIFYKRIMKKSRCFSVQTKWKIKELSRLYGIEESKIAYWPNGVEIKEFSLPIDKKEARLKLNLPLNEKIILYLGHFFSWKGANVLALASSYFNEDTVAYFVGGTKKDAERFKIFILENNLKQTKLISFQPHETVPYWLKSADVLVLPNTAKEDISKFYTSPMKLFEYMASERPIVASNIPSLAEILNASNAILVEPDNPQDLARGVNFVLNNREMAAKLASQAYLDVQKYTWTERAARIKKLLEKTAI
ncbi:MAG: glycosyltransferase family 4 protein, partial [bacterium]|nr:glycosyltransferase family 4 protein [bacterium]